jgi:hypothetical protein
MFRRRRRNLLGVRQGVIAGDDGVAVGVGEVVADANKRWRRPLLRLRQKDLSFQVRPRLQRTVLTQLLRVRRAIR